MEKVHEELEDAKAEIERLNCKLDYKECIIKQLSSTTEAQLKKLEDEKKKLLLSIDEAYEQSVQKQVKFDGLANEVESLKGVVSVLQNKCAEAEKLAKSRKNEMWEGGDLVQDLEDKYRKVEDELKWKVEQFGHLEAAHDKLREQLKAGRREWEKERLSMVGEISRLQEEVDEGQGVSDKYKFQLAMCRQTLENEEGKRKRFERQVEELKLLVENGTNQSWDGKKEIECSTAQNGEEEVVNLRHSLRMKEMECKDAEYNARKLEKENQELLASVKELQEAHIPRAMPTPSSWEKLRGKLKTLEQRHKESSANFKAKEVELNSRTQEMTRELSRCTSTLQIKEQTIAELKKELADCNSSLTQMKMQNEELSLMLQLMRSEFSESGTGQENVDKEGCLGHLMQQLEKEREEKLDMQKELDKYRDFAEEASDREREVREELEAVYNALDTIDAELTDKTNEGCELELELQSWISIAERLKMQLEESQEMRRELEECLLAQAEVEEMLNRDTEEKDRRISNLEEQILLMDQEIRIGEEDDYDEDKKQVRRGLQMDDDDKPRLDLMARELELTVLVHMTEERTRQHQASYLQQSLQDYEGAEDRMVQGFANNICAAKENVIHHSGAFNKTGGSIIDQRSPFRELN